LSRLSQPVVTEQFFWPIRLGELVDWYSFPVENFVKDCKSPKDVCDKVIRLVQYPYFMGHPEDRHQLLAFRDKVLGWKWKRCVKEDFWSPASYSAVLLIGDCEDSSILAVAGHRKLGLRPDQTYEVFGVVRDARTNEILGGHGWNVWKEGRRWLLCESTLDVPPPEYPIVADIRRACQIGNILYCPELLFNDIAYEMVGSEEVFKRKHKEKETEQKYEAIAKAWRIPTKPIILARRSRLRRIRRFFSRIVR